MAARLYYGPQTVELHILKRSRIDASHRTHCPGGVINVVTGGGSRSGQYLLDHPGLQKLAFTGSTEIGYDVYKAAQQKMIPATLELGGKSANIYFDDCRWDMAMDGAQLGILFNQGQVCCAGSRIFRTRRYLR